MWTNPGEIAGNHIDDDHNGFVDDIHGYDFANHDGDPMDDFFHGTHVAGTIAAVANNDIGISGVAPNVQIMALKFLDASGGGVTSDAIAALNYAVANGATISNNSWGGGGFSQAFQTTIQNAANHGHIFVAAAGNDNTNNDSNPFYPANYNVANIVSVAATDAFDNMAWFSNYGKQTVDLGAPGVDIYSTMPTQQTPAMFNEGLPADYGSLSGTSMATPHVTGVIALVRSQHPDWTAQQVIQQVLSSVDPIPSLAGATVTGGRLNAAVAVGNVPVDTTPPRIVKSDPMGITTGPADHFHVVFSEPIDPATFDASDVVGLSGPFGPLAPLAVTPVPGNDRQFDIWFDPQSTSGDYALDLGPHITDLAGNEVDQNGDGFPGEDGGDDYLASFTLSSSSVYSSPDVPVAISGFNAFGSYLTIDQDLPIGDLNVKLNLNFPRDGNLNIWLVSPQGTAVDLSNRHGAKSANFRDTIFDDEADTPIAQGAAPFAGSFQPDEALSSFDSQSARGTWELFIQNVTTTRNRGTLNAWSLDISPADSSSGGGDDGGPNDPPTAVDDSVAGFQDTPLTIQPNELLANDDDPNGDPLTIVSVGNASGGTVELNADGSILFSPDLGGLAPCSFQYVVSDGLNTAVANVTVYIQPIFNWHNLHNGNDVDNDGLITAGDALLVINQLNAFGTSPIFWVRSSDSETIYYDVVPDNLIAPDDALSVINFLNSSPARRFSVSSVDAAGEGQAAGDAQIAADASALAPASTATPAASSSAAISAILLTTADATPAYFPPSPAPARAPFPTDDQSVDAAAIDQCLTDGELHSLADEMLLGGSRRNRT
jgi:subtilisin-like proprotein convertase family protein